MTPALNAQQNKTRLLLESTLRRFKASYATGDFAQALAQCLQATRLMPTLAEAWADAAVCCVRLERWDEAIEHGLHAARLAPPTLAACDALAHAYGGRGQLDEVRRWGLAALEVRARSIGTGLQLAHQPAPLPPPPSAATQAHNLIAFSLFGGSAKYCECAVLNVIERQNLYPDWTCRFYVDDSVPAHVVQRLRQPGSEVIQVTAERKARWPGPMWRFLAYDSPGLHRVIFRDADSVIGKREAGAVEAWIASGRHFHLMRDAPNHTELILAGLWGVTAGALPPMSMLVGQFLRQPVANAHFADQLFLRQWVWPYARSSLLQHDAVFGFRGAEPFPDGPMPEDAFAQVGAPEGAARFRISTTLTDGVPANWTLYRTATSEAPTSDDGVCTYPARIQHGAVTDHLPNRYAAQVRDGRMSIRVSPATA